MTRMQLDTAFTDQVARLAVERSWEAIPTPARELAAQCVLDWFAVALRGSDEPVAEILWQEALQDGGAGVASAIGRRQRLTVLQAALVNGAASHALDYDDVHLDVGHPSAAILPALLALAESRRASGRELVTAFIAGYEAACMVGGAIGKAHYDRGFHTTATIGIFGAAVACARLLDLPEDGMRRAIGIAATQAAGLKAMFGTMCKPFHAGRAARDGLHAARLSAAGLSADTSILDGRLGFLTVLGSGTATAAPPSATTFELTNNLFKYHAACYLTHAAIDGARRIGGAAGFNPGEIEEVVVTANASIEGVCNIPVPDTGLEMKFSLRYAVAMALAGFDTASPEAYADARVKAVAQLPFIDRIRVELDAQLPRTFSRVQVRLRSGQAWSEASDSGTPAVDLGYQRARLIAKFNELLAPRLDASRRHRFISAVFNLPQCTDAGELFRLIQPSPDLVPENTR